MFIYVYNNGLLLDKKNEFHKEIEPLYVLATYINERLLTLSYTHVKCHFNILIKNFLKILKWHFIALLAEHHSKNYLIHQNTNCISLFN